ncbi:MAG: GNAT family N-acetyltransferase [Pseudomonadota bacterium]
MTPDRLAALHAASFVMPRPWSAREFVDLLASPAVFLLTDSESFLLARVVAEEAELLTLAVAPAQRRQGIGRRLVARFVTTARSRGAARAFLEVSAENLSATNLYKSVGFAISGRRKAYFRSAEGRTVDALVMTFNLQGSRV